jgi:Tfp pilus assembly protein PilO
MADEQQPVVPVAEAPAQAPAPAKKSNVWLWIIGGCLGICILIGIAILALGWWGVHKVKQEIKKNQPKLEQMQKDAENFQKQAEQAQKQAEQIQKNMPVIPDTVSNDVNNSVE